MLISLSKNQTGRDRLQNLDLYMAQIDMCSENIEPIISPEMVLFFTMGAQLTSGSIRREFPLTCAVHPLPILSLNNKLVDEHLL